jgi:hypothetical protein
LNTYDHSAPDREVILFAFLIQIHGESEPLDEGDGAGDGLRTFQPRLFDQKAGDGAVGDLQNRR